MRLSHEDWPGALAGSATWVIEMCCASVTATSTKCVGLLKTPGLTAASTLPFGSTAAGPSAESRAPLMLGISGPWTQVLVSGLKVPVCGVPQIWNMRPFGSMGGGPISCEPESVHENPILPGVVHEFVFSE